jgi:hypothetical protein
VEGRTHEFAVACAGTGDVKVHGACDGVVFGEIGVFWASASVVIAVTGIDRMFFVSPGALAAPDGKLVLESEDCVLPFVLVTVDRKALACFPAPDGALAAVKIGGDLFPRLESSLWGIPFRHGCLPAESPQVEK